jgi:hypothetical protein
VYWVYDKFMAIALLQLSEDRAGAKRARNKPERDCSGWQGRSLHSALEMVGLEGGDRSINQNLEIEAQKLKLKLSNINRNRPNKTLETAGGV